MTKLLEDQTGARVFGSDGTEAGVVSALYSSGEATGVEFLLVRWAGRGEEALVPVDEVAAVEDRGVVLRTSTGSYGDLPAFDPARNPLLHRIAPSG